MRWQGWRGGRVLRWQGGKLRRVVRWQGRSFVVLFKTGRRRVSSRLHLFVSDLNQ